jgi:hypothetical protein
VSTTCLKEGMRDADLSSQSPLEKDNRGPPLGLPSAETKAMNWEAKALSWSIDSALREQEKLVQGAALGPRRDQAQQRLDRQRREHQVRVFAFFALQ